MVLSTDDSSVCNLLLASLCRDSFANIVDLLDDMFERAAQADDEPSDMNFIKKHAQELIESGVDERPAARLFSNPYVIIIIMICIA